MSPMNIAGFASGPYKTNCYVAVNESRALVVDPGMHAHAKVTAILEREGAELEAILLTHGHIDHTRDAGSLAAQFNVPVYIHPDDEFMLDAGEGVSQESQVLFDAAHMTPISDLRHLADGATLQLAGTTLRVAHAPGHSPGSTLLIHDEIVFTGDVLFRGTIGRTDFALSDPAAMSRSLAGPVGDLDDALAVLPGHGPTTTMRMERTTNPYLVHVGRNR